MRNELFTIGSGGARELATLALVSLLALGATAETVAAQTSRSRTPARTTSPTPAPAATSNTQGAHELFDRGTSAYATGNYELALDLWSQAYAIDSRPRIQYNISQAYERLGRLEEAIAALERYLESAVPNDPQYADANARLASMRQRLSLTGIVLHATRPGGEIRIDEAAWGSTPRPDRIPVAPGPHVVTIRWGNGDAFVSNVLVPAGQSIDVAVDGSTLVSEGAIADVHGTEHTRAPRDGSHRQRRLFFSLGGASAALGVGALVWGIERNSALGGCHDAGYTCLNAGAVKTERILGFVGAGVFLAGAGTLFTLGALSKPATTDRVSVSCGVGISMLACAGRF